MAELSTMKRPSKIFVKWYHIVSSIVLAVLTMAGIVFISTEISLQDTETWSGYATKLVHIPFWIAEWQEYVPPTYDSEGRQTGDGYWRTVTERHSPQWIVYSSIGDFHISKEEFEGQLKTHSLQTEKVRGYRPDFKSGDRYDYIAHIPPHDHLLIPVTQTRTWKNRLKTNKNTLYSFVHINSEDVIASHLYEYPTLQNPLISSRLRLIDGNITIYEWDKLNAFLGPRHKINLFLIEFPEYSTIEAGHMQQALWKNGKKNDLVLCVGGQDEGKWAYVFGWSESELVKANLQSILMDNSLDSNILPLINEEIQLNYKIFDWEQLSYLNVSPPIWGIVCGVILVIMGQFIFWFLLHSKM